MVLKGVSGDDVVIYAYEGRQKVVMYGGVEIGDENGVETY